MACTRRAVCSPPPAPTQLYPHPSTFLVWFVVLIIINKKSRPIYERRLKSNKDARQHISICTFGGAVETMFEFTSINRFTLYRSEHIYFRLKTLFHYWLLQIWEYLKFTVRTLKMLIYKHCYGKRFRMEEGSKRDKYTCVIHELPRSTWAFFQRIKWFVGTKNVLAPRPLKYIYIYVVCSIRLWQLSWNQNGRLCHWICKYSP